MKSKLAMSVLDNAYQIFYKRLQFDNNLEEGKYWNQIKELKLTIFFLKSLNKKFGIKFLI